MTETTPATQDAATFSLSSYDKLAGRWAHDERLRDRVLSPTADIGPLDGPPISNRSLDTFERPSPALTPAQRLHLDIYGYVVIENVLTPAEVEQLRDDIYDIERRFRAGDDLDSLRPAYADSDIVDYFRVDNLPHIGPSFFDCLTHPRIVGMAEEIIGGPARLTDSSTAIRRPPADPDNSDPRSPDNFHRGSRGWAGTIASGLYHFNYARALINLTDLGPDDGGTRVIPGTHKIPDEVGTQAMLDAAIADPSLIHQVEAPAGSLLLFWESLVHSSGTIRSGRDRVILLGGYAPHMSAPAVGHEPAAALVRRLPMDYQRFFLGWYGYAWPTLKSRSLADQPPT